MIFIENQADNLAAKFKETINQLRNNEVEIEGMANITSSINELIRNEFIILPQDKTSEYFNRNYITINPEEIVTNVLVGEEFRYTKIFANSFGPFNPQIFSTLDRKYRILWLLKEPYIELESWRDGDKGGHDQASEYQTWEEAKKIPTYRKLISYSRKLLEQFGIVYTGKNEAEIMEKYMWHICIIEVNHFPGLAFNKNGTDDPLIKKWYEINQDLLKILVDFYDPQILIGGGTFNNFIDEDFKEVADNIKNEKLFIFGDLIENWSYVTRKDQKDQIDIEIPYVIGTIPDGTKDVLMNIKYKGNKRYYIQTNHPSSPYAGFEPDFAEKFDGPTILRWMNS